MSGRTESSRERTQLPPCPVCGQPAQTSFRPFCSTRCADVDLGRWFGERYVIPSGEEDEPVDPSRPHRTEDGDR